MRHFRHRGNERGQSLVLAVLSFTVMVALLGVVIDGGYLYAQQRMVQNSGDSAAEAGAIVLASRLGGAPAPSGGWDAQVNSKVMAAAAANALSVTAAYYTDWCGIPLKPDGTAALTVDGSFDLATAARVGGGGLPTEHGTPPDCPSYSVGPVSGVLVIGHRTIDTFFARVVGVNTMAVTTTSTARAGWLSGICDSSDGESCALLPLAIPVSPISCLNNGDVSGLGGAWNSGVTYVIPLCKNGPGNVGWLDWTPPGGGTSELIDSILHPNNPAITLPMWMDAPETGNTNSQGVVDAINTYVGQVVLVPMFDVTCPDTPDQSQVAVPSNFGCPDLGGNGQNQWYRFPAFAAFRLCGGSLACSINGTAITEGAYKGGSVCNLQGTNQWSGAGCLAGQFVNIIRSGPVSFTGSGGTGPSRATGIQLIK
jgi:hypothetical protein